jgi:hypothetical protein
MARHLAKKPKSRTRLNIQLSPDVLDWAKSYARRNNTTVTRIIDSFLRGLREKDIEVPQI